MGKECCAAVVQRLIDAHGTDERIEGMHLDENLAKTVALLKQILDLKLRAPKMPSAEYKEAKVSIESTIKDFKKQFNYLLDLYASAELAREAIREEEKRQTRNTSNAKKTLKTYLLDGGAPKSLAKFVAHHAHSRDGDRCVTFVQGPEHLQLEPRKGDELSVESFGVPRTFVATSGWTPAHDMFNSFYKEAHAKVKSSVDDALTMLRSGEVDGKHYATRGLQMQGLGLLTNHAAFQVSGEVKAIQTVQLAWEFSTSLDSMPFCGLAHFLVCHIGFVYVLLQPISEVIARGFSLDSMIAFLDSRKDSYYEDQTVVGLNMGQAVFVPFGYAPLTIAISDKKAAPEYAAFTSHFVLNPKSPESHSKAVRAEVKAWVERSLARDSRINDGETVKVISAYVENFGKAS